MKEQLITLETAILAKEKGFDWTDDNTICGGYVKNGKVINGKKLKPNEWKDCIVFTPTQSLLQKWLREKHNIHIEPQYSFKYKSSEIEWWFYIYPKIGGGGRIKYFPQEIGENLSYEKALEKGLEEALKLIKK
ncbi:MAG: hypothetical protein ACSLE0_08220 [Chitinophagaceae bacterium]